MDAEKHLQIHLDSDKKEIIKDMDKENENATALVSTRQKETEDHTHTKDLCDITNIKEEAKDKEVVDSGDEYISDSSSLGENESEEKDNTIEIQIPQEKIVHVLPSLEKKGVKYIEFQGMKIIQRRKSKHKRSPFS